MESITSYLFYGVLGSVPLIVGMLIGIRFLCYFIHGVGGGHIQSLLLAVMMILLGFMIGIVGLQADVIAANRKLLEDIRYEVKKRNYENDKRDRNDEYANMDGKNGRGR